jgi:Lamin Tail Domain
MRRVPSTAKLFAACVGVASMLSASRGAIIINEILHDDAGTDDREFTELFNNGAAPVDISGWIVRNFDTVAPPGDNNADFTIPAGTTLAAGDYYVIGLTGVLNVDLVVTGTLENDNEGMELLDSSGAVQDTVVFELNKGAVAVASPPAEGGVWGNNQAGVDLAGTPLNGNVSIGRFVDGRDTNNNGRDISLRPSTPGTSNHAGGFMTVYAPPDPAPLALGSNPVGLVGSFVNPRVIDTQVADANNPNVIAPPSGTGSTKAYVAWDPAGGGNGATSLAVYNTGVSNFAIKAFLETADMPVNSNAAGTQFTGSEVTIYGIGGGDTFTNLTDLSGAIGLAPQTLPLAESANGFTGIAWVYERTSITPAGGAATEKLYLVDANDGGDSDVGGNTPLDWTILATIPLEADGSAWHDLSISIDALGNGVATFDGQVFNFTTIPDLVGAFNVGYRENLQIGSDGTPDAIMRPATFTIVPEPGTIGLASVLSLLALRRRRN